MRNLISSQSCTFTASLALIAAAAAILPATSASAQVPVAQYKAVDYNPATGVWLDSSGNGKDATVTSVTNPTLALDATPNGSAAVNFDGTQWLTIGDGGINYADTDYTIFAFLSVDSASADYGIVGSQAVGLVSNIAYVLLVSPDGTFTQNATRSSQIGTNVLGQPGHPTDQFVNINTALGYYGGSFRFNGASDSNILTQTQATNDYPISSLGAARPDGTAAFKGQIAEIRIYERFWASQVVQDIENQLQTAYVTPIPEPTTFSLLALSALALITRRRRHIAAAPQTSL